MKPLYSHLVLRWQKLEAVVREIFVYAIYLANSIYCEPLISWSYFVNAYFVYIQPIICDINVSPLWQIKDGRKYFCTPLIEIWESVSPSLKCWWTLRLLLVSRLWQKCFLTTAWRDWWLPLPSSWDTPSGGPQLLGNDSPHSENKEGVRKPKLATSV